MADEPTKSICPLPGETKALLNHLCLVLGLVPAAVSCAFTGSPLGGYCPLDIFRVVTSLDPSTYAAWTYASWAGSVALFMFGALKRPFGIVFFVIMSLSLILLYLRFVSAMSGPE